MKACAWLLLAGVLGAQVTVEPLFGDLRGSIENPNLSPDGKTLAFTWRTGEWELGIYTRPVAGGVPKLVAKGKVGDHLLGQPGNSTWSPDGTKLAFTRHHSHADRRLTVLDLASGKEQSLDSLCDYSPITWSPDGRYVVASRWHTEPFGDCQAVIYAVEPGKGRPIPLAVGDGAALSPDGRRLAFGDGKRLMLLPLTKGYRPAGPARVVTQETRSINEVAWVGNDQLFYSARSEGAFRRVIALQSGVKARVFADLPKDVVIEQLLPDGTGLGLRFSPRHRTWRADLRANFLRLEAVPEPAECDQALVACSVDGQRKAWIQFVAGFGELWVSNRDGSQARRLIQRFPEFPDAFGYPNLVGWSPDGKWIAFLMRGTTGNTDFRSRLYVIAPTGGVPRWLARSAYAVERLRWSSDSRSLVGEEGVSVIDPREVQDWRVRIDLATGQSHKLPNEGLGRRVALDGRHALVYERVGTDLGRFTLDLSTGAKERLPFDRELNFIGETDGAFLFWKHSSTTGDNYQILRLDQMTNRMTLLGELGFSPQLESISRDRRYLYLEEKLEVNVEVVRFRGASGK